MAAPRAIEELVQRFDSHKDAYRSGSYNEAQLREEFLNPFFAAMGWDVYNKKAYAEAYKEVIHEDAIKIGGRTKAPDYCFRAGGGVRSFFVEAKKPSVDIRDAVSPAYQLRRYAWSAKLPVSILTDFEEFAVYDCRVRPVKTDKAATARIIYKKYTDYLDAWDDLAGMFSPEAIRKGQLDKFVSSKKVKKGTAEVDAAFLVEIESWRDVLARNIALRNPDLSQRDLNFAVGRTIDRVIFLRICEDRGIEPYGALQALQNGSAVYRRLAELFQRADDRYNSGLFYFTPEKDRPDPPDELTLALSVDDGPLKGLIKNLYYPDSPYEFSVLPADILGQVYEQFLGKVIRLTPGHRAVVEEKPEVKKAGGVYYTPKYIVDYIVGQTVGKLVEGKTPLRAAKFKILDPACGSGSFLIGAYQFLLDWHRDYYVNHDPQKHATGRDPRLYRAASGDWRLTTAERKRILLNNIHGVDIDPQAVEVTKLSLLLKVLEGESQETLANQLRLFHERALPDLAGNIKCGNSLIGPDFYDDKQMSLLDEEQRYRINVFDWKGEFVDILKRKNPGFDVVIGNPPYRKERDSKQLLADLRASSYGEKYYQGKMDFWCFFLHRGIDFARSDALLSFIVPSYWLKSTGATTLVDHVKNQCSFLEAIDFGKNKIFKKPGGQHMVFVLTKSAKRGKLLYRRYVSRGLTQAEISDELAGKSQAHSYVRWLDNTGVYTPDGKIDFERSLYAALLQKLAANSILLESDAKPFRVSQGIVEAPDIVSRAMAQAANKLDLVGRGVFVLSPEEFHACSFGKAEEPFVKRYLRVRDVGRYHYSYRGFHVLYIGSADNRVICNNVSGYRNIVRHLSRYKQFITSSNAPYGIHRTRRPEYFAAENLLCRNMFDKPCFTYCYEECYVNFSFNVVVCNDSQHSLKYLLGILNSTVGAFWFNINGKKRGVNNDVGVGVMRRFPVHAVNLQESSDKARHDRMVELVEGMLSLHKELDSPKTGHARTVIERQIEATDRQIDRLVYELYELSDEEIAIVEEATG